METLAYAAIAFGALAVLFVLFQRSPEDEVAAKLRSDGYEPTATRFERKEEGGVARVRFSAVSPDGDEVRGHGFVDRDDVWLEFEKRRSNG